MIFKLKVILLDELLIVVDVVLSIVIKCFLLELSEDYIIILLIYIMVLVEDLCDIVVVLDKGKF